MNKTETVTTLTDAAKQHGPVDALYRVFGKSVRVRVGFSQSVCRCAVEELMLSVRSYNALRRAQVTTLGELIDRLQEGSLKGIRNLGRKSISEIQTKVLLFGFERLSEKEKGAFFHFVCDNNAVR